MFARIFITVTILLPGSSTAVQSKEGCISQYLDYIRNTICGVVGFGGSASISSRLISSQFVLSRFDVLPEGAATQPGGLTGEGSINGVAVNKVGGFQPGPLLRQTPLQSQKRMGSQTSQNILLPSHLQVPNFPFLFHTLHFASQVFMCP